MKAWFCILSLVLLAATAHGTIIKPPPPFEEMKQAASFIGIVEVVQIPPEPAAGHFGDKPPTVSVKVIESWKGDAKDTSHGYLWDAEFRPVGIVTWNFAMGQPPDLAKERIILPTKGERFVVFAETQGEGVWRDVYGWRRRPIVQNLPAGHSDGASGVSWSWGFSEHCLRVQPLVEISRTRDSYGRQEFLYTSEPADARTKGAMLWTDVCEKGDYWVLSVRTAVKMTVTAIERNHEWPARYTVQKGDSLVGIARRFYDDEARWKDIGKANNIKDASRIQSGMVLVIPAVRDDK